VAEPLKTSKVGKIDGREDRGLWMETMAVPIEVGAMYIDWEED
jgi:hypothetical protein